jgi:hypothetical protein
MCDCDDPEDWQGRAEYQAARAPLGKRNRAPEAKVRPGSGEPDPASRKFREELTVDDA